MLKPNFLLVVTTCLIGGVFGAKMFRDLPKCKSDDNLCIKRSFTHLFRNGHEYPEMKLEPLNPFKPKGAHDSFTVRIIDSGLGLSVVGVASKMSVYGFDKMKIQQIEGLGPNCENTNIKLIILANTTSFYTDDFTAKINLLTLPTIATKFSLNTTHISNRITINLVNDIIHKNGKTYLAVKKVNVKNHSKHLTIRLQSKELSPMIISLINKAINTHWRDYYGKMLSEIEDFTCTAYQSIISSIFDNVAVQDFYQSTL